MEDNYSLIEKEKAEEEMIQKAFNELLDDYLATKHRKRVEIIRKAFNFSNQAHKGIRRRSGEPYILHPIAVAKIVCNEIGLGSTSICSALLHDVVEDTDYTIEDIENIFGPKIAQIVNGLTKISGGIFGDKASAQAENFKKLLLTMSDDIRVILIKIADRLHNMRTLGSMLPNKQYKIAGETLYIYAPLANRLGLNRIKTELEDLSFKYEHPDVYKEIEQQLERTAVERDRVFQEFTRPIKQQLDKMGLKYHIQARVKSIYSIWRKMQTKHVPFEEIYDILAVRIVFEPKSLDEELNDCFDIYVSISKIYKPHPDRLRDWVSHPKANGYQALHVTLMANNGQWIEVQIRSERMNDVAEQGFAAHWKYKEGGGSEDEGELDKWLKTIKEILEDPQPDAMDFLDTIKLNLFASEIFVFTPKGDIKTLPQNATALDFAFSLHTDIGSHSIGAKVNHKLVALDSTLHSGDQVEILTSKSQRVQPDWEGYVTTAKARNAISSILNRDRKRLLKKGEFILKDFFQKEHIDYPDEIIQEKIMKHYNINSVESLYVALATQRIRLQDLDKGLLKEKTSPQWKKLLTFSFGNKESKKDNDKSLPSPQIDTKEIFKLTDKGFGNRYVMASCCCPIPGDDVLGYLDGSNSVVIHKRQCPVAARLKSSYGNKIVATEWDTHKELLFPVIIQVKGIDEFGLMNEITNVISSKLHINIQKIEIESKGGIFEGRFKVIVHDVQEVRDMCNELKQIKNVKQANRMED